jgi:5-formyltetrahydrofolate cyclo-ligase
MDEIRENKELLREEILKKLNERDPEEVEKQISRINERLFDFANYLESKIVLLYTDRPGGVPTQEIIARTIELNKIVVLPVSVPDTQTYKLMKVDDLKRDLKLGARGFREPDPKHCKEVPIDCIDIAFIPGIGFDEKGGRLGVGQGYYDRLIPELPITTRKISISFEDQIAPAIPMESHDKYVDIIITEKRIIYKI